MSPEAFSNRCADRSDWPQAPADEESKPRRIEEDERKNET